MFGRGCVGLRSLPFASPTTIFVRSQLARRFVGFVAQFASISWVPHCTLFWNRSRSVCRRGSAARQLYTLPGNGTLSDPDRVLVLLDLSNAFDCVSRGAVLSAVRSHFPWLALWADTCYRHDSNLLIGSSLISSQRGVQQGDHSSLLSSHWHSTPASQGLLVSRNHASQVISTTTPFSTMGSLQVGLRRSSRSSPSKSVSSRLV